MSDLTLIYYTANRIDPWFASNVRFELVRSVRGEYPVFLIPPVVCVIQGEDNRHQFYNPWITFDETIIPVGLVEHSIYRVYQNVLLGAKAAKTEFIACCEDDTLYHPSHFTYRPPADVFGYDRNRWVITRKASEIGGPREAFYYWRERTQMAMCIAPRQLMIDTLEEKFAKYPTPPPSTDVAKRSGWGEPGRYEKNLKLTPRTRAYFDSSGPSVTFNHAESLMGRRKVNPDDTIVTSLEPWGDATALWKRIHG